MRLHILQHLCLLPLWLFLLLSKTGTTDEPEFQRGEDRMRSVSQTISAEVPLVIAHRGASGYLPEHTAESAAFAHALGSDYIEQDVVLTKDGIAVVLHDISLNHVTDVADVFPGRDRDGKFYAFDFTWSELTKLAVHERTTDSSRGRFPRNLGRFQIMTLREQIELIHGLNRTRSRRAGLYVEIKQPAEHRKNGLDPSAEVLKILNEYGYSRPDDRAYLQCFDEAELLRIRTELKSRLPLIQLFGKMPTDAMIDRASQVVDGVGVPISAVVSGIENDKPRLTNVVDAAHARALMVHVWTLRTDDLPKFAESPEQLLDWLVRDAGVDGVFTDQPDVVLAWRRKDGNQVKRRGPFHLLRGGPIRK